jgi:RNA polymerase sigma-70 factor (ECF subfamily)
VTLPPATGFQVIDSFYLHESTVNLEAQLNSFLREVESRAFYMAKAAVGDADEALDIVQDAMFTLARKYRDKGEAEWRPLFYRILQNRITDAYRRRAFRSRFFVSADDTEAVLSSVPGPRAVEPSNQAALDATTEEMINLVSALPHRQQQAFLLRALEGMSVAETAKAMRCSQGSVKTHYSRAVHSMREQLEEHWS